VGGGRGRRGVGGLMGRRGVFVLRVVELERADVRHHDGFAGVLRVKQVPLSATPTVLSRP
jgi:hypothetical protein